MILVKGKFELDGIGVFEGYHNPDMLWNGWNCPHFELDEAQRLMNAINEANRAYMEGKDILVMVEGMEEEIYFNEYDISYSKNIEHHVGAWTLTQDNERLLYSIGAWAWCWSEVFDTADVRVQLTWECSYCYRTNGVTNLKTFGRCRHCYRKYKLNYVEV